MRGAAIGLMALMLVVRAAPARAEGFISPFVGYNFGGDAGCPQISNCNDKRLNAGVAVGAFGDLFGFEEEFGYAKHFFGSAPNLDSSVLTVMSNLMLVPSLGPIHPYALAGVGLVKTHVVFSTASLLTSDNNDVGWDAGGGLIALFGSHVGLRGDVRYIHSLHVIKAVGVMVDNTIAVTALLNQQLNFGRFSGALVFAF